MPIYSHFNLLKYQKICFKKNKFTTVLENKNGWNWWTEILTISRNKKDWQNHIETITKMEEKSVAKVRAALGHSEIRDDRQGIRKESWERVSVVSWWAIELFLLPQPPPTEVAAVRAQPWPRQHVRIVDWRRTWIIKAQKEWRVPLVEGEHLKITPGSPAVPTLQTRQIVLNRNTANRYVSKESQIQKWTHRRITK